MVFSKKLMYIKFDSEAFALTNEGYLFVCLFMHLGLVSVQYKTSLIFINFHEILNFASSK